MRTLNGSRSEPVSAKWDVVEMKENKKYTAISQDCEMWRLPNFLENRLTDGGEFARLTRRPRFTLQEDSGTNFRYRLSKSQSHSVA
jgi:hypothetical protein